MIEIVEQVVDELRPIAREQDTQLEITRRPPEAVRQAAVLIRRRGRIVPREELLANVWADAVVTDQALNQALYQTRRVLGDDGGAQAILQTVRRRGLRFIAEVTQEHDLLVITDEVYEHLVFSGSEHVPMATLPGMGERTVTVNGMSKTYSVTGWRVGYAIAPPKLTAAILFPLVLAMLVPVREP